jgi:signal transduction histidine kinase
VEALHTIEVEASRTLAEMRAMVRMLRGKEAADYTPQPGLADLDRLGDATPAGPRVEVSRSGDLHGLPAQVDAAVFRIAQEAVTNAARHARNATRVDVRVTGDGSSVRLVVRDDGDRVSIGPGSAPGFGVTGMVERAALLGGTCAVGPCPDSGWAVEAWLPRQVAR